MQTLQVTHGGGCFASVCAICAYTHGRNEKIGTQYLTTQKKYIMGKIFKNSVKDAKKDNMKEKQARFNAAEQEQLAKKLEGETYGDNRSEMCKLIARAEESATADIVSVYADYVVKHTFAELRKLQRRYYRFCSNDVVNIDGVMVDVVDFRPVTRLCVRHGVSTWVYIDSVDKPLMREAAKVVRRLWLGRQATNGFSFVPSQTEKDGEKVLERKPVTDLHTSFMAMQRSNTALDWAKIEQAAKERKEETQRVDELETLRAKVMNGTATAEEMIRFATLAK